MTLTSATAVRAVSHHNSGLGGGRDGGGDWRCMQDKARSGWSHVGRCQSTSTVRDDTLMSPHHTAFQVRSPG